MVKAAVPLYDFQRRWLEDTSRFKIGNMSRQIGKSFIVSLEAALDAAETGDDWILLSAGERQSKELMSKAKMHCEAMKIASSDIEQTQEWFNGAKLNVLVIYLPNGARIIGLPANPDTARGFSGNVILDEFAFQRDSFAIWKALFPTISRGYKIRVVSTPQGKSNRFYTLMTAENKFSKHTVDIYQAVADGVPHNIEELKDGIDDEETWQQEYLVQFIDEASSWLTYELIAACEDATLDAELTIDTFSPDLLKPFAGETFGGMDIGRRKDLSVIWPLEKVGDVFWTRNLISLDKQKFSKQRQILNQYISLLKLSRMCIDSTGKGEQLSEEAKEKFGSYTVEMVDFTNSVKKDMAVRILRIFEDRRVRIPVSRKIRNDLHNIKKTTTAAGNIRFDAERTKDGHSDRFWALALALMASDEGVVKPEIILL